jgi:hypothetical protein
MRLVSLDECPRKKEVSDHEAAAKVAWLASADLVGFVVLRG